MDARATAAAAEFRASVGRRQMYGSSDFDYDLEGELTAARERTRIRIYWRAELQRLAEAKALRLVCPQPPTREQLLRHVRRYGHDLVNETAASYPEGPVVTVTVTAPKQRRTTERLRDQVLALRDRGLVAAAIADTLNVSDRRVAEILRRVDPSPATPDFPLNQANGSAAKAEVQPVPRPEQLWLELASSTTAPGGH